MPRHQKIKRLLPILEAQPVIPVLIIEDRAAAVPLARALVQGGLPAIEITLRTEAAMDAIRLIVDEVEGAIVGAGTVLSARDYDRVTDAGARFVVSPGTTQELLDAARDSPVPLLPGAVTPSEVMAMREEGYSVLKFFPAEQAGGASYLKSLASPLADMRFCPTGGVGPANVHDYLDLPNVICVGGSWVAPNALVEAEAWDDVERLAQEAARLRS